MPRKGKAKQVIHETPVLTQFSPWTDWRVEGVGCWLCDRALQDRWHIPEGTHGISLEVSAHPLSDAWRIRFRRCHNDSVSAEYWELAQGRYRYLLRTFGTWLAMNLLLTNRPRWLYVRLILHEDAT